MIKRQDRKKKKRNMKRRERNFPKGNAAQKDNENKTTPGHK